MNALFVRCRMSLALVTATILLSLQATGQWVAYNDHNGGGGTAANVTTYSLTQSGTAGETVGGPLWNSDTGGALPAGVSITSVGMVSGVNGTSQSPRTDTPADQIFAGRIDWASSALFFGPDPYDAAVAITFTNLTPGRKYRFRGTSIRGNSYAGRWALATLAGASSATPAHLTGTGTPASPGIVTNGWSPYGDALAPVTQAAWNCGENQCGDVIGWDDIVPAGTSFSVICSNYHAVLASGAAVPGGTVQDTYCYAISAFRIEEVLADGPPQITAPMRHQTNVVGTAATFSVGAGGTPPLVHYWYTNNVLALTSGSGAFTSAPLALGSNFLCTVIVSNAVGTATNSAFAWGVANSPPAVSLASPADNATFAAPANISLVAAATDGDGTVARVDFYSGAALLGTVSSSPFNYAWNNVAAGNYTLTVVATDNGGLSATSAPVNISVVASTYGGLEFNGAGSYVTFGMAPALGAAQFTLETWFRWTGDGQVASSGAGGITGIPLLTKGRGESDGNNRDCNYFFGIRPADSVLVADFEDIGSSPNPNNHPVSGMTPVTPGVWHHAAATYDGTNWQLFLDGLPDASAFAGALPRFDSIQHAALGTSLTSDGQPQGFFAGVLDEARIWNYARSEAQIASARFLQIPNASGLVGRWALDEPSGAIAHDSSGNAVDGTLVNGPVWVAGYSFASPPLVALAYPTNGATLFSPGTSTLSASASDLDGTVTNVAFFAGTTKLGDDATAPFEFAWSNPTLGYYALRTVATDNSGLSTTSAVANVVVQNAIVQLTSPTNGASYIAPDPVALEANASDSGGAITLVEFFAGAVKLGQDSTRPFSFSWDSTAGSHVLTAVATASGGIRNTSAPVNITVTPAVTNTVAPTIIGVVPTRGASLSSLTFIQVTFSEIVTNVEAADLLVNGSPATGLSGIGSNFVFSVTPPGLGVVNVTWTTGHGIRDLGRPPFPFNAAGPGATWSYTIVDSTPPVVVAKNPPADAVVTNLTQVAVTFSEPVAGVNADDLLINGNPAISLTGSGTDFTFAFPQPAAGAVSISWAAAHGITDLGSPPNAFDGTGSGATWSYLLDNRVVLVESNSNWQLLKAYAEASSPIDAWRQLGFDDTAWSNAPAPFFYGDPYNGPANPGTPVDDMRGGAYSSIFLRSRFFVPNAAAVSNLFFNFQSDDGCIVWINGFEVLRYNMAGGDIPYDGSAPQAIFEPTQSGAPYLLADLSSYTWTLADGTNVLAVHAFNNQPFSSSDFGFNAQLYAYAADAGATAPRLLSVTPSAGSVFYLTNITVTFTEPVGGVNAGDLLINGVAATSVSGGSSNTSYTFSFAQPAYGAVSVTWAANHGITDFDTAPKPFDGTAAGSTFQYALLNPSAPVVASQNPVASATVTQLTQITVTFSEAVTGVDAADLMVNAVAATGLSGSGSTYTFTFTQPAYGAVNIGWRSAHGIKDLEVPANDFDATRPGCTWSYTLLDQTPPAIAFRNPPASAQVTNLTQLTVTFTEAVSGVDASDLLINGAPASSVSGGGASYTFSFAQPNASVVNVTWSANHGIRDLAASPNSFNATAPGATWSYTTPDTVPPTLANLNPPAYATVRSLSQISVTFTEPVAGLDAADLLINNVPAQSVSGAGAGPYVFQFPAAPNGLVTVTWAVAHGIRDLATPANPFVRNEWAYTVDPNASPVGKVLINEIMFDPLGGNVADEWIELHNVSSDLFNLAGWRFTRGVDFTFPNATIPAGGYLVVAANVAAFQANYPGVANVVGGWIGRLANSDETIELQSLLGEGVDSIHYASEGDWARRERGSGARVVTSITRSGTTATVSLFGHGYTPGDVVQISGADQSQYNGLFTVTSAGSAAFTYNVPGSPASPATGHIFCRLIVDSGSAGWSWFTAAGGFGSSLELINPALPNTAGQNWLASTNLSGTPGAPNSVRATNVPPFLLDVTHFPIVPRSSESVTISARALDELTNGVANVTLFYRNHTANYGANPPAFNVVPMLDDGTHNDGNAGDGLYAATIGAQGNRTIMEFYVQATDLTGLSRTWPAPAWNTNHTFVQRANALYQVDDEAAAANMPFLRIIMTGSESAVFPPADTSSDAQMNATFISMGGDGTKLRYNTGMRIRGAGSRGGLPKNFRVNVPTDNRWNGITEMNLNSRYVHAQLAASVLAQKAGLASADARVVQVRVNGQNLGSVGISFGCYVLVEPIGADWAANHYPLDGEGNVYRASKYPWNANLDYLGTDPAVYFGQTGAGYYKNSNRSENDWTDLFNLTYALSPNTSDADYVQAVSTNVNVEEFFRYFVVVNFFDYMETSIARGVGDDYAMYRGLVDPRFRLIGHDFDTVLGQGDTAGSTSRSLWSMVDSPATGDPSMRANFLERFMRHPAFAPTYFRLYKQQLDTTFSPAQAAPLLDQMLGTWAAGALPAMKLFVTNRHSYLLGQIPLALTVESTLPTANGYLYTTAGSATLSGYGNIIDTRRVRVNGALADWTAWQGRWNYTAPLQPGLNRVLVQAFNSNDVEIARASVEIWRDGVAGTITSGIIASDTAWSAANGPYNVTGNVTVNNGATLTIQAGTTVFFGSGVNLTVANGGRLRAEGTETALIRFARVPGGANWGGLTVNGGATSPETRIAYAHFEGNGSTAIHSTSGTVFLDHLTFGNTAVQYVSLDGSSFVVQDCVFPTATAGFELVHGTAGIKAAGRGLFLRNFFGAAIGYNDVIDFTGGNRPGPILQFLHNVFIGTGDDHLDLDSTDAWIEGNIFLHAHKNGSPDTASAVSGGADNADTSQVTIIGNLIYDCDQAAMAKQGNFFTLLNNTIVHQTHQGGLDTDGAVVCLADDGTVEGAGMYLEGNIVYDAEKLVRNLTSATVTFTNNLLPLTWAGPGGGNFIADPLFHYVPQLAETTGFTSWSQAQVLRHWFSLRADSPAAGRGPNATDLGAPLQRFNASTLQLLSGVSLSGEPSGVTRRTTATLTVGQNAAGSGIPTAGWPNGSGYTHYQWRLDGGAWSAETPIRTPISLSGLSSGPHTVEARGRRDAGFYQNDAVYGTDASVTVSRTWTVNPTASPVRLSEILAANAGAVTHSNTTPDLIELYNDSSAPFDLSGVRLTDDPQVPGKFMFPEGASIPANGYLVVYANNPDGTPGHHLGFNLNQQGEAVYLYDAVQNGGALLDSVSFGPQITDLSIGRLASLSDPMGEGQGEGWALTVPTFGAPNRAAALGDPTRLRINEWLALGQMPFDNDFIELYNADPLPVSLGGLFLSDEILGQPGRHQLASLSFIPGRGYLRYIADADPAQGPDHLNFSLSAEQGALGLYLPDLRIVDLVLYQPQFLNMSQGRSPNGSTSVAYFDQPTPGAPNPLVTATPQGNALVLNEVLAINATLTVTVGTNVVTPDWVELYNGTANTIALADFSLTDDPLQARRWVFPSGTQLAPAGYLRVLCSSSLPASTNQQPNLNTGFGLNGNGGSVYLFDSLANGGSLLSAITYGLQVADLSIGRVPSGGTNWTLTVPTPATANTAVPTLADVANLKVNEWMADPGPGQDDWFEIYNPNPQPVALGGLWLSDDLNLRTKHQIAALSFLGVATNAWAKFVADGNTGAGADHVGFSLRAAGEAVGISTIGGALIDGYAFAAQEQGVSEGRFPDGGSTVVRFPGTESPGASNYRRLTDVVINEALTHTDLPLEDAIELRNLTAQPIDLSGWWLSDDNGTLQKYQLPFPTLLPANSFLVVYETAFTNRDLTAVPFSLSSKGDEVVLSASAGGQLTGWRTSVKFGAAENSVSFGRYVTSVGKEEFVAMSARTFGADDPATPAEFRTGTGRTNAYPKVGPVVISEIMYHPPDLGTNDNVRDEFIELHNRTTVPVTLYDPNYRTNTWHLRDGVDFDFPTNLVIPAGGYLLVVSFNPTLDPVTLAAFRANYGLGTNVPIVGPYLGKLDNGGEAIELKKPDAPNTNDVPYILVEQVKYADAAPWDPLADGGGFSLQRVTASLFGDDPANWTALAPTPGSGQSVNPDLDGDGMPNDWETAYGLNPNSSLDANQDADGDGLTNLQEYLAGTIPNDPTSGLKLQIVASGLGAETNAVFNFQGVAAKTYTVQFSGALPGGWSNLINLDARPVTGLVWITNQVPSGTGQRFYRVLTPRQP
ncbi:MAG: lamin tail domain-containing protein [Verrucomicrobia bacterium]|nr:lamin tail domain-containing protein [Verrucomicrobiota bacterium]